MATQTVFVFGATLNVKRGSRVEWAATKVSGHLGILLGNKVRTVMGGEGLTACSWVSAAHPNTARELCLFKAYATAQLYFVGGNCKQRQEKCVVHGMPCTAKLSENWQPSQFCNLTCLMGVIEYTCTSTGHVLNLSHGMFWMCASVFSLAVLWGR